MTPFKQCQNESHFPLPEEELSQHIEFLEEQLKEAKHKLRGLLAQQETRMQFQQEDEILFRHFIASNVIGMHRSDIYGRLYEVNDACVEMLGYSREELLSRDFRWRSITPPEYHHTDDNAIEQIKRTGMAQPWEKEYIRKDGSRVPILIGVVATDTTGRDCIVFTIDLTHHKRIQRELKTSEERFRIAAEASPNIVWMAREGGRVIYANQTFYSFTGMRREDDDGFAWLETVHPDDRQKVLDAGTRAELHGSEFEHEIRYRSKSGQYRWFLARALPLCDKATNTTIWYGTCTDIDDQKRAAQQLRDSEARLRLLADAIPQIVWTANPQGEIQFFNHRWFEYTGLTLEQSIDGGWQLLIHPDDKQQYLSRWNQALETAETFEAEFRLKRAAGKKASQTPYRWHLCRAVPMRGYDGRIVKWFATWTEIESQKGNKETKRDERQLEPE